MSDKIKEQASSAFEDIQSSAKAMMKNPQNEIKKSGKDWLEYIQTHPLQSVLFGIIGYFALKGICSND